MVFSQEDHDFYQRLTLEIKNDGLHSVAEASEDEGKTWRKIWKWLMSKLNTRLSQKYNKLNHGKSHSSSILGFTGWFWSRA